MGDTKLSQAQILAVVSAPSNTQVTQAQVNAVVVLQAQEVILSQAQVMAVVASAMNLNITQAQIIAVVKYAKDTRRIRAWRFVQDDHDFYVVYLGPLGTFIWDKYTKTWSRWKSPDREYWRGIDGLPWDQDNVCIDPLTGDIWNIDPDIRMDDTPLSTGGFAQTPIVSIVRGMLPMRLRNSLGCYGAYLTLSQGSPVVAGVGITLRTSDDNGRNFNDHGTLVLDTASEEYQVAWQSLGLVTAPGKIFEIIDTGYAWRLDALDVDLGPDEGKLDG